MHHIYFIRTAKACKLMLACSIIALLSISTASAQSHSNRGLNYEGGSFGDNGPREWGIALSAGYDAPVSDLGTLYSGAPTFSISILHNYGDFTFSSTIGYVSYKPKQDTIFADPADHTAGYFQYGNFSSLEIYAGVAYNIHLSEQSKLYFGLNIGTYFNSFSYSSDDGVGGTDGGSNSGEASYIAPKLGMNFIVGENVTLGLEAKYNFELTSASGTGDAYDSGYATTVDKSVSINAVLTFGF